MTANPSSATSRELISELLQAKADKIYDEHLQNEVRLDGWKARDLGKLYLEAIKDTSLKDLSHGVMDLLVLTVCAEIGTVNRDLFYEKILVIFGETMLETSDIYSQVNLSFDHCTRDPLQGKAHVWNSRYKKRPFRRKPQGPANLWSTWYESWPL